jgi:signal-transduction protein with cAMP-binding, CBS, and nucleotidyltransferase domain
MLDVVQLRHSSSVRTNVLSHQWSFSCSPRARVPHLRDSLTARSDRDICMATYTQGKSPQQISVREAMAQEVFSCLPDDSISEVEEIMRKYRVRRVPVVDLDGRLVGLISLNDLARETARQQTRVRKDLTPREVTATLAAICQPRSSALIPPAA